MFRLPRSLNLKDKIEITGKMIPNPERFFLNLITGTCSPDYKNIACQLEFNFLSEKTTLCCIENGVKYNEKNTLQNPSDLFPDSEFKFIIKMRVDGEEKQVLDIDIGKSHVDGVELKHNLGDITHFELSNDTTKVEELKFMYT